MDYQRYPFDLSAERGDWDKLPNVSQARAGAPDKSLSFRARVTVGDTVTRMVLNFSRTSLFVERQGMAPVRCHFRHTYPDFQFFRSKRARPSTLASTVGRKNK